MYDQLKSMRTVKNNYEDRNRKSGDDDLGDVLMFTVFREPRSHVLSQYFMVGQVVFPLLLTSVDKLKEIPSVFLVELACNKPRTLNFHTYAQKV